MNNEFTGTPVLWTPVLTFATPGDLSVAYTTQKGYFLKFGHLIIASFVLVTSSFTFSTASGNLRFTGLPYTSSNLSNYGTIGSCIWNGITKAGYTQINPSVGANVSYIQFAGSASGSAISLVTAADTPSAGQINIQGSVNYMVD